MCQMTGRLLSNTGKRGKVMFETTKVGRKIKEARVEQNMTQMNLADAMGVSYQAVSNWERGNSMPDISKLPELCDILHIRMEELLGEESRAIEAAKKFAENRDAEVTISELAEVAPLVTPDRMEKVIREKTEQTEENGKPRISISQLIGLAPFLGDEDLDMLAESVEEENLSKFCGLAPFLSEKSLDKIVDRYLGSANAEGMDAAVCGLAPFLSEESLDKIVEKSLESGNSMGTVTGLAPFLAQKTIHKVAEHLVKQGRFAELMGIAPFLDGDILKTVYPK